MRYLHGDAIDQLLAGIDDQGTAAHYYTDHLGSVRHMTDHGGVVRNEIDYDAFGNITSQSDPFFGDRYTYASREFDAETEFYHNRARYYFAKIATWTSEDPSGFSAGDVNLFRYINNSPTNATDPSGLWQWPWSGGSSSGGSTIRRRGVDKSLNLPNRFQFKPQPSGGVIPKSKTTSANSAATEFDLNNPPTPHPKAAKSNEPKTAEEKSWLYHSKQFGYANYPTYKPINFLGSEGKHFQGYAKHETDEGKRLRAKWYPEVLKFDQAQQQGYDKKHREWLKNPFNQKLLGGYDVVGGERPTVARAPKTILNELPVTGNLLEAEYRFNNGEGPLGFVYIALAADDAAAIITIVRAPLKAGGKIALESAQRISGGRINQLGQTLRRLRVAPNNNGLLRSFNNLDESAWLQSRYRNGIDDIQDDFDDLLQQAYRDGGAGDFQGIWHDRMRSTQFDADDVAIYFQRDAHMTNRVVGEEVQHALDYINGATSESLIAQTARNMGVTGDINAWWHRRVFTRLIQNAHAERHGLGYLKNNLDDLHRLYESIGGQLSLDDILNTVFNGLF